MSIKTSLNMNNIKHMKLSYFEGLFFLSLQKSPTFEIKKIRKDSFNYHELLCFLYQYYSLFMHVLVALTLQGPVIVT